MKTRLNLAGLGFYAIAVANIAFALLGNDGVPALAHIGVALLCAGASLHAFVCSGPR